MNDKDLGAEKQTLAQLGKAYFESPEFIYDSPEMFPTVVTKKY